MNTYAGRLDGAGMRVAIVASRFNDLVTERLVAGARDGLVRNGVDEASITLVWTPGAFELAVVARRLALSGDHDAIVCVGAVIRGTTDHYTHVATQCGAGLARVALDTGVPVVFGVLTTDTTADALDRAGGKLGNKGYEGAVAAVEMVDLLRQLPKSAGSE
ncbi:MAG: 6,7-dimethyl-8-ribityllumazine synthase [Acidimicrobiales bacterium]